MSATSAKRAKKTHLPPSYDAHPCAVLAVDPGESSGWAIYVHGGLVASGECDVFGHDPEWVIGSFLACEGPHVVVVERPFMVRFGTQVAVGAGDVIWRRHAERAGLGRRIVRVYPATWRARVTGMSNAKREAARAVEQEHAARVAGRAVGPDQAAAICIGLWAIRAGEVAAKIPKKRVSKAKKEVA